MTAARMTMSMALGEDGQGPVHGRKPPVAVVEGGHEGAAPRRDGDDLPVGQDGERLAAAEGGEREREAPAAVVLRRRLRGDVVERHLVEPVLVEHQLRMRDGAGERPQRELDLVEEAAAQARRPVDAEEGLRCGGRRLRRVLAEDVEQARYAERDEQGEDGAAQPKVPPATTQLDVSVMR